MKVELDQFELFCWLEGCSIGSNLRQGIWDRAIGEFYGMMTDEERLWLYTYAKRDITSRFLRESTPGREDFFKFLARFNPANQYKVTMAANKDKVGIVETYKWQGEYYINARLRCAKEHIRFIKPYGFKKDCNADYCMWRNTCKRFNKKAEGAHCMYSNAKCDWYINKSTEHGADLSHFEL